MSKKGYSKVVLVGRTNVGKSTIFNRLSSDAKSIVFDRAGVTRDYVHEIIDWHDVTFDLIDTGGIPFKKVKDPIMEKVRQQVFDLINEADVIVFVCDVKAGLLPEDRQIAQLVHKAPAAAILVLNKADNPDEFAMAEAEFVQLGFDNVVTMAATHGRGMAQLLEKISYYVAQHKPTAPTRPEEPGRRIAIIGKPNVGKSSLLNILLQQERAIVSEVAGTTREPLSERMTIDQEVIELTDTAGIRRKRGVEDPLEELMVKSSFKSLKDADLILLVIDGSTGELSDQEKKLLFYAAEHKKALMLVINKTDIQDLWQQEQLAYAQSAYEFFLNKIPIVRISCATQKNIGLLRREITKLWQRMDQTFDSTAVNEAVKRAMVRRPMFHTGIPLKVFKVRWVKARIPTFVVHVSHPEWFGPTQQGFIENVLRSNYDLQGCPVQLLVRPG